MTGIHQSETVAQSTRDSARSEFAYHERGSASRYQLFLPLVFLQPVHHATLTTCVGTRGRLRNSLMLPITFGIENPRVMHPSPIAGKGMSQSGLLR